MKNRIVLCLLLIARIGLSQITLDHSTNVGGFYLSKFSNNGYKYVQIVGTSSVNIYNLNHTLFNTFNVPAPYNNNLYLTTTVRYMYLLTDNLFDTDNGFEYVIVTNASGGGPIVNVTILNDNGTIIMSKDSAQLAGSYNGAVMAYYITDVIYFDGISTKMKLNYLNLPGLTYKRTEIYNLPGYIPCQGCTTGAVTGLSSNGENPVIESPQFFPNPASDQLKLKYKLPDGSRSAEMKIYDTQGKLVDEFKVTDAFDFIYLPTNFNNGLYLYSLIVDGKVVKTEKIVLNK